MFQVNYCNYFSNYDSFHSSKITSNNNDSLLFLPVFWILMWQLWKLDYYSICCYLDDMRLTVSASLLRAARSRGVRPARSGRFRSAPASTRSRTAPFWPFRQAQLSAVSPSWSAEVREAPGNTNRSSIVLCCSNTISKGEGISVEGADSHPLTAGALRCSCGPQRQPASVQCDPACRWHWYLCLAWAATPQPGDGRKNHPGECNKDRTGEIKKDFSPVCVHAWWH